ncbi:MAG: enoyl-CoA hydratase/isomerase family protein [Desulfarculus sp.]|nr:enoyl-CoA hydratase/isomerase family protein [Pseudomonadota bacterium]MBV1717937.1 enoyl-CoA hydratase/isomerase family protein [Desulfarculus sp.]MBU4576595.1 enoyl-CoA hydratase/isomerase family protein [Pseudomonadota bacterium]MBU4598076.1 enoyl-CoA hydratase/isomerase family protein [Pseudomonadota bacterium]MBV1739449.1 enoyl-CoA hydratase/isomerase family protein [Desulfarculus sp.]
MELKETIYQVKDQVALITLNRPERLNAYTPQMRLELIHLLGQADQDDQVRAVVVTGAGRAFCAGMDLAAGGDTFNFKAKDPAPPSLAEHRDGGGRVALAAFKCRKPVIAAMNGAAVGVGITMTLAMDMRVAAEDAKMGLVFTRRGLVPEACSTWFLTRLVGAGKALELACTGRVFRAKDQAGTGLFNYILPADQVLPKALELAQEIAANTSATSVALAKAMLWHGLAEPDPQSVHLLDSKAMFWTGGQKDAAEGIQSFLEKRPPEFKMSPTKDMPDFYPWWKEPKV